MLPSVATATRCSMPSFGSSRLTVRPPNSRWQAATMASNTGCVSVTDALMTRSTSAEAFCCSSASLVSLNRRTFSSATPMLAATVVRSRSSVSPKALSRS